MPFLNGWVFIPDCSLYPEVSRMMEIMRCNLCGKLAMIVRDGGRRTICCDQLMEKLVEQGDEQGTEPLHVPVVEKAKEGIKVRVPGVADPMKEDHYIEWIEVTQGDLLHVKGLKPGDKPEAGFPVTNTRVKVRVYCEKHGIWSNKPSKPHT